LAGTRVEVHVAGDLGAIDPPTASALARTLQEGLTNACKHAPGAAVVVRLDSGRITTVLQIQNERPAKPSVWIGGGGNGLRGIRERVSELGGTVRSAPTPSGGWLLRIELPAAASPARSDLPAEHRSEADSHS
jgi:signal transduction histidine kinase